MNFDQPEPTESGPAAYELEYAEKPLIGLYDTVVEKLEEHGEKREELIRTYEFGSYMEAEALKAQLDELQARIDALKRLIAKKKKETGG